MPENIIQTIQNTTPLVALVVSMALSMLVIPIARKIAPALGMIDLPEERKIHTEAIPRVGGLGIIIGALIAIFSLLPLTNITASFIVGALVLSLFGMWDDSKQVGPYTKFFGQFIAVAIVVVYGDVWIRHLPFTGIEEISPWIGIPFTFFAIIGMANAVNTSDGLDGLAGGESLLSLIVIAFLAYIADGIEACVIATACMGGIFGFLRYNTHPAQIFMGDTGSQFLGYSSGFLAVLVTQKVHPTLSPALTLLFLGLPVIDILAVMIMRIKKGHSPFHADKTHIHHRLMNLGYGHYETVIVIYSLQALLVISAIFFRYESDFLIISLYVITSIILFGLLNYAEKTGWRSSVRSPSSLSSTVYFLRKQKINVLQATINIVKFAIPAYLIFASLLVESVPRDFGMVAIIFLSIMLIDLLYYKEANGVSVRGGVYIAAIFSIYLMEHSQRASELPVVDILFFFILAISIAVVVRYAADKKFETSPMDYLIVFGVFAIAVFGGRYLQIKDTGILIVKGMIILYGCELLFTRMEKRWNSLNISTLIVLIILGYRSMIV